MMYQLRTFGGLCLEGAHGPVAGAPAQRKALALLGLLAAAGARGMSRDKLMAFLWPESPADKASHRLTQLIYTLRRDLGAEEVLSGAGELRLNPALLTTDVAQFTAALEGGEFPAAAAIYGGPFLDGFFLSDAVEFERWADGERTRLAQRYSSAVESLAREASRGGELAAAAGWWHRLVQAEALNARVAVKYMEALAAVGDRAGALRFGRAYEALVRAELDADPDPSVVAALEAVTRPAAGLAVSVSPAPAIAVLPFVNLTPDRENEYFSDGMTDELTSTLARAPGLRVASRISAFAFKGQDIDVRRIASQLGVSALVAGTVRNVGNRIRLTAHLVSGTDGCLLWSETYDRTLEDVFALQEELSRAIVAALPLSGVPPTRALFNQPTAVLDAYTLYLRGRYSASKRTPQGLALAVEYFEQAVEQDPKYAAAHAGLAECWALRGFIEFDEVSPDEAMPRSKAAASQALELDPRLASAHTWLGVVHTLYDWDWTAAEAAFRRALQLGPTNAIAHAWYAMLLAALTRHDEGLRRALYAEALEPAAYQIRLCVARSHYFAGRYQAALECLDVLERTEPHGLLTSVWRVRALCAAGRFEAARRAADEVPLAQRTAYFDQLRAVALAGTGRHDEARALLSAVEQAWGGTPAQPVRAHFAHAYVRLGDHEAALTALEEGARLRSGLMAFVAADPLYDDIRGHPRFRAIIDRLRLPG